MSADKSESAFGRYVKKIAKNVLRQETMKQSFGLERILVWGQVFHFSPWLEELKMWATILWNRPTLTEFYLRSSTLIRH